MESVEKTAKTVEEAITDALIELGATRDEVEIEIIEKGSKGFLGLVGNKDARVLVKKKKDLANCAVEFLEDIFTQMGLSVKIDAEKNDNHQLLITFYGENMGILIGKRGQTLDALQYLVNLVINRGQEQYVHVTLDTENYRQRRKETLENLARNLAKKAKQTKRRVQLEPMTPYERRIIHATLQNDRFVKTHSEGEEPYRKVVISPVS
jgi:spoIIIJ-associated protein